MKVILFDLSEVGEGADRAEHLSGIPRVESELFRHLPLFSRRPVWFTSARARHGALKWLRRYHPDAIAQYVTPPSFADRARFFAIKWAQQAERSPAVSASRLGRWIRGAHRRIREEPRQLPPRVAAAAALFHSTARALPPEARAEPGMACVLTVHDLIPILQPQYSWPTWNSEIARAFASLDASHPGHHVICVSEATRREFLAHSGFPGERVTAIPLAADRTRFFPIEDAGRKAEVRRRLGLGDAPFVLSLCQIAPRKNMPCVINAFAHAIRATGSGSHRLVLAGRCSAKVRLHLFELASAAGVADRVVVTGFVPDEYLPPLYAEAETFLFPSFAEGFGLPVLEAMSCGTPVVCSDLPALREVSGGAALHADPSQAGEMGAALAAMLGDASRRAGAREQGLRRAELFSWEGTARATLEVYERAISAAQNHLRAASRPRAAPLMV